MHTTTMSGRVELRSSELSDDDALSLARLVSIVPGARPIHVVREPLGAYLWVWRYFEETARARVFFAKPDIVFASLAVGTSLEDAAENLDVAQTTLAYRALRLCWSMAIMTGEHEDIAASRWRAAGAAVRATVGELVEVETADGLVPWSMELAP